MATLHNGDSKRNMDDNVPSIKIILKNLFRKQWFSYKINKTERVLQNICMYIHTHVYTYNFMYTGYLENNDKSLG